MKIKSLALLTVASMAASAFGQGLILDNLGASGNISATSNGRVFMAGGSLFDGVNKNLGVNVYGGPVGTPSGSLTSMGTFKAGNDPKGYTGADLGQFQLGAGFAVVNVPGVSAGTASAQIYLEIWYDGAGGLFNSFSTAQTGGGLVGTAYFVNGVSNPNAAPPVPAPNLGGMPSVTLAAVPEPSVIALGALGVASLLVFRRRN